MKHVLISFQIYIIYNKALKGDSRKFISLPKLDACRTGDFSPVFQNIFICFYLILYSSVIINRLFLVNDMQAPPPPPPEKWQNWIKRCGMLKKQPKKKQFSDLYDIYRKNRLSFTVTNNFIVHLLMI